MQNVSFIGAQAPLALQISQNQVHASEPVTMQAQQISKVQKKPESDVVEIKKSKKEAKEPQEKVPFRQKFLNFVASMKKTGVNISEYGKGFFTGLAKSAAGAVATVGAIFTANQISKSVKSNKGKAGKYRGSKRGRTA